MKQRFIPKMNGYKATNALMQCQPNAKEPFQFEIGVWYEVPDEIKICESGFHFCGHPSGVWAFYSAPGTRVFKIQAEDVLDLPLEPGAFHKHVARRIRLVEEVVVTGDYNTGVYNAGSHNAGNYSTGNYNVGDYNVGNYNTGDYNTGCYNVGYYNVGSHNAGNRNVGNRSTGDYNVGSRNAGDYNVGDYNTGDYNVGNRSTGDGNATSGSSGFFCTVEPRVMSFDMQTEFTRDQFIKSFPEARKLAQLLHETEPVPFEEFAAIPGITREKLEALHKAHLGGRK